MGFLDRRTAGRLLGTRLRGAALRESVVLGVARGGVIVAAEVADLLSCPLDVLVPRKLPSPYNEEVAIGALAQDGTVILDHAAVAAYGVGEEYLRRTVAAATREMKRRLELYREGRPPTDIRGKTAVVVDDGIATGYTLRAALRAVRKQEPETIVLAVPVAAPDALEALRPLAELIVCLETPEPFYAVGQAYSDFSPVDDLDVTAALRQRSGPATRGEPPPGGGR